MNSKRAVLLILSIGFIVYANIFGNQFVWDDEFLVVQNDYIKSWGYLSQMLTSELRCFSSNLSNYYRPLQTLSYAIDYSLWRLDSFGYHLSNLILHLLCAYLVYLVVKLFYNNWTGLLSSLLFLIHPLSTQVVTYISGRADSLVGLFFLSSFYLFVRAFAQNKKNSLFYFLSILFYAFALITKEISLIFPLIFLSYLSIFKPRAKGSVLLSCLPYVMLSLGYLISRLTILDFTRYTKEVFLWQDIPFLIRLFGFGQIILSYLGILAFPLNLHMNYASPYPVDFFGMGMFISLLILVLVSALFWLSFRISRTTFFFMVWFFILLFPTANIILPLGVSIAPHWLYLPAIGGFSILAAYLVKLVDAKRGRERFLIAGIIAIVLFFYGWVTLSHNSKWRDNTTLYLHELKYSPDDCILHNNLGNEYRRKGLYSEAEQEFQRSIALNPKYPLAYNNLGLVYLEQGFLEKAINSFQQAAGLRPDLPQIFINLGRTYQKQGRTESALASFRQAIEANPLHAPAYHHLGVLLAGLERRPEAIHCYQRAIEVNPLFIPAYYNLGFILKQQGDLEQAQSYWQKALNISPSDIFIQQALKELKENEGIKED